MSETKSQTSDDFTNLTMIHLGLDFAREMWYFGDIKTLTTAITKSADFIEGLPKEKRRPQSDYNKNPLDVLQVEEFKKWPKRNITGFEIALGNVIEKDAGWPSLKTVKQFKEMMEGKQKVRVFFVPIDPGKKFYTLVNHKGKEKCLNAKSIITLLIDYEFYKNAKKSDTKERKDLLIMKDIFNISGQNGYVQKATEKFRGAKFLFKKAMEKVVGEYNKKNTNKPLTQVATAPWTGDTGDGENVTTLKNRRASFTRWGFKHMKSEPEYYGLQKFQSIPEYGYASTDSKRTNWGLIDYNLENVTRVKLDGNRYKIGGKTFDNVLDALKYEKYTVSLLSQGLTLENSSGEKDEDKHKEQVTSTIRFLDWLHSVKHTKQSKKTFNGDLKKPQVKKVYEAFKKKFTVSDNAAFAKDHYYRQWLYNNLEPGEKKFLFNRYVNYIFEIPLKQSYNEWLQRRISTAELYQGYKEDVLYVSEEARELFKQYDNTQQKSQLDTNELQNLMNDNLEKIQNAIVQMDKFDQSNDNQLDIGEFENLYQDLKFQGIIE